MEAEIALENVVERIDRLLERQPLSLKRIHELSESEVRFELMAVLTVLDSISKDYG